MTGVVADANFIGLLRILVRIVEQSEYAELWEKLSLRVAEFADLGLAPDAPDRVVWTRCQTLGLVLLTGNRNDDGPDSLQATIADSNTAASLPVFTVGTADRIMFERGYAERVAIDMLEYLIDLRDRAEHLLGSGRLYLPKKPV
jgi:hypothetical protein